MENYKNNNIECEYLNKLKNYQSQSDNLVAYYINIIVILSFAILNIFFGQGEELVAKMKIEEERIARKNRIK